MQEEWDGPDRAAQVPTRPIEIDDDRALERLGALWRVSVDEIRTAIGAVGPMPQAVEFFLTRRKNVLFKKVTSEVRTKVRLRSSQRVAYWTVRKLLSRKADHSFSERAADLRARVHATERQMRRFVQDLEDHRVLLATSAAQVAERRRDGTDAPPDA